MVCGSKGFDDESRVECAAGDDVVCDDGFAEGDVAVGWGGVGASKEIVGTRIGAETCECGVHRGKYCEGRIC